MTDIAPSVPITGSDTFGGGDTLWVLYAPCSCRYGWLLAVVSGRDAILDEETAWHRSSYSAVHQIRMRALGFRWVLEIAEDKHYELDECEHKERYEPAVWVRLDGHRWVAESESATEAHLVPMSGADMVELASFGRAGAQVAPLCGVEAEGPRFDVARADPCPECERIAVGRSRGDATS